MPPKLRRPAAAPGRGRVAREDRLRRPASQLEEEEKEENQELDVAKLDLEACQKLQDIEVVEGRYWEEQCKVALRVREVRVRSSGRYMMAQVLGTQCEALLKAASGLPDRVIEVHLCWTARVPRTR